MDALSVLYAGRTQYSGDLWPHNHHLTFTQGSVRTHYYTIQSLGRSPVDLSIGTFIHESGHMLCRFPDLYDYGKRDGDFEKSAGMGRYCAMSSGSHLGRGKTPSPICAYTRDLAGWCETVEINDSRQYQVDHGDYKTVHRFSTELPNEYFLVENRFRLEWDAQLTDDGLAVYHCDRNGSNEHQDGTPVDHYQCALLQGDGREDLERNVNVGDATDLFPATPGVAIDASTNPSSREWSGSDSGFVVSEISGPGQAITFRTGPLLLPNEVSVERKAHKIIPDNKKKGITDTVTIERVGVLNSIPVTVDISHTYRGDLVVELESPDKTRVVLHRREGGRLDDLRLEMADVNDEVLQPLLGKPIHGQWTLRVRDLAPVDSGRLNEWSLVLGYDNTAQHESASARPDQQIPDFTIDGVWSDVALDGEGTLREIEVAVDVTHPFIGDLSVDLTCPSGRSVILLGKTGMPGTNLRSRFSSSSNPLLAALRGEKVRGTWMLCVRDLLRHDEGTFDAWAIDVWYD